MLSFWAVTLVTHMGEWLPWQPHQLKTGENEFLNF